MKVYYIDHCVHVNCVSEKSSNFKQNKNSLFQDEMQTILKVKQCQKDLQRNHEMLSTLLSPWKFDHNAIY